MELPARESVASEANAIDFVQLYRAEKRRARANASSSSSARLGKYTNKNDDGSNHNAAASKDDVKKQPQSQFPPWKYPELLIQSSSSSSCENDRSSTQLVVPRLDRTRDCLSQIGIFYQPHFLAEHLEYQSALWEWLSQLPVNNQQQRRPMTAGVVNQVDEEQAALGKWTVLPHARRRVALFDATASALFPPPLQWLVDVLVHDAHVFPEHEPPNHILINHYTTGDQGILPHTDGPAYHDRTATISLGPRSGSVLLNFVPNDHSSDNTIQILLHGGGSLIVFEGSAYRHYRHGIAELRHSDSGSTAAVEHASEDCCNAPAGTAVIRGDERISITVRRRRRLATDGSTRVHAA